MGAIDGEPLDKEKLAFLMSIYSANGEKALRATTDFLALYDGMLGKMDLKTCINWTDFYKYEDHKTDGVY